jgi:hypothetical protein
MLHITQEAPNFLELRQREVRIYGDSKMFALPRSNALSPLLSAPDRGQTLQKWPCDRPKG